MIELMRPSTDIRSAAREIMQSEGVGLETAAVELLASIRLLYDANHIDFYEAERASYAAYLEMKGAVPEPELTRRYSLRSRQKLAQ
jgi:hypothetical protein